LVQGPEKLFTVRDYALTTAILRPDWLCWDGECPNEKLASIVALEELEAHGIDIHTVGFS